MTPDQRFTLLLTALGLVFTMLCALFGLIWRAGNKQGETSQQIKGLAEDMKQITGDLDRHIEWHLRGRRT